MLKGARVRVEISSVYTSVETISVRNTTEDDDLITEKNGPMRKA